MKFAKILSVVSAVFAFGAVAMAEAVNPVLALPLEDVNKLPDQILKKSSEAVTLNVPALPEKPGSVAVLRCRMVSYADTSAGCNFNAQIKCNGKPVARYTSTGEERMIGRSSTFALAHDTVQREFPVFSNENIMTMFAPDCNGGDATTTDNLGATFLFQLGDLVRGVDGNAIEFKNIRAAGATRPDLMVTDIEIGYLKCDLLPKVKSSIPVRKKIAQSVKSGNLTLELGNGGGFAVIGKGLPRLQIETGMGMTHQAESQLLAGDDASKLKVSVKKLPQGGVINAEFANGVTLKRAIELTNGEIRWRDTWNNRSAKPQGIPFRNRLFMAEVKSKFYLGGDGDTGALESTVGNPTLFLQDKESGRGYGIVAENDVARLLIGLRGATDIAEIYTTQFALEPGKSLELEFRIMPEMSSEGYFAFINRLRQRWLGANTVTAPGAYFWNTDYRLIPGEDDAEKIRTHYAHLGPAVIAYPIWARLGSDVAALRSNRIKLGARHVPENPDDLLANKHREYYYQEFARLQKLFRENAPEAKLIMIAHPAMEIVYTPLFEKMPIAPDAIRTAEGGVFNDPYYSRAYLGDAVKNGWAIYYFVPKAGGAYEKYLIDDTVRNIVTVDAPGIYFDEFSFSGSGRGYSRYDYSAQDGFSADLDRDGNFVRFKSDNVLSTVHARQALVNIASSRGKLFYCNGPCALTGAQRLPVIAFTEGGNGLGKLGGTHLSQVPTALGNFGDNSSLKGVFGNVKAALKMGSVYSPHGGLELYKDKNNFVCKMFPLTVRSIHEGTVIGKERVITARSGTFELLNAAKATLYRYNASGELQPLETVNVTDGKVTVSVPADGLVIAEAK